jgi:hypothetical protein
MTWLTPITGLILAMAVIPPLILLYFLKLRRRPHPIASTFLWKKAVEDLRANAPFQRLRRSILLLLQLIALVLLALSLMQPQLQGGDVDRGKVVILIDNSASMTADDADDGGTRLAEAKKRARSFVESLWGGGIFASTSAEGMVIAFSDRAEIMCRFTSSRALLLDAIDRVEPTHGESNIAEALKLARAYTTNVDPEMDRPVAEGAHFELFSDGRIHDLEQQVLRDEVMRYHPIGQPEADNVAFSAIAIDRPYDRPTAVQVFAGLINFSEEPVTCEIQLSVDGAARHIESVEVEAATADPATKHLVPGRNNVVFSPFEQPRGAVVELANLREDDLAVDNIASIIVAPSKNLRVGVAMDQHDPFLITALEGIKLERLELLSPDELRELAASGTIDPYDVVVLSDVEVERLPRGRYLTFGTPPPFDGLNPFGDGKEQIVLDARSDHPALRFVQFESLFILQSKLVQPADHIEELVEGNRGPLIMTGSREGTSFIHVTFNPLDSNWFRLRSFPNFVLNAVEHLGHLGEAITAQGFAPGEAITARLPATASNVQIVTPDGTAQSVEMLDPEAFSWGPARLAGLHVIMFDSPDSPVRQSRPLAVNLISELEGDIRPAPEVVLSQDRVEGVGGGGAAYIPLWPWAVGVCLVVVMLEWWTYHRKAFV